MKKEESNRKTLLEYWFYVVVFLMVYCIVPMLNHFIYEAVMAEQSGTFDILFFVQYEHWLTENQSVYWVATFLIWLGNVYVIYWSIARGINTNSRRDWHVFSWVFAFGFIANACTYVARPDSVQHDFEFVPLYYSVGSSNLIVCQRFGWQCYSMWKTYQESKRGSTKTFVVFQAIFIIVYLSTTHQLFISTIGFSIVLVYMVDRLCESTSYKKASEKFLIQLEYLKRQKFISDKVQFPSQFTIDDLDETNNVAVEIEEDDNDKEQTNLLAITNKGYDQVPMGDLIDHGDVIEESKQETQTKKGSTPSKINGIDTETIVFSPSGQYDTM